MDTSSVANGTAGVTTADIGTGVTAATEGTSKVNYGKNALTTKNQDAFVATFVTTVDVDDISATGDAPLAVDSAVDDADATTDKLKSLWRRAFGENWLESSALTTVDVDDISATGDAPLAVDSAVDDADATTDKVKSLVRRAFGENWLESSALTTVDVDDISATGDAPLAVDSAVDDADATTDKVKSLWRRAFGENWLESFASLKQHLDSGNYCGFTLKN